MFKSLISLFQNKTVSSSILCEQQLIDQIQRNIITTDMPINADIDIAKIIIGEYEKFNSKQEEIEYHDYHLNRYLLTLDEIAKYKGFKNVLEVGAPPYGLSILIKNMLFENVSMSAFNDKQNVLQSNIDQKVIFKKKNCIDEEYNVPAFNLEMEKWPYDKSCYDMIIASEVLEHLAYDPMRVFCEANRILREDGIFLVTVPNAISYISLSRMIRGENPNGFPYYRPEGITMRHNREITCEELKVMYESAGFEIQQIKTVNPYPCSLTSEEVEILSRVCAICGFASNRKELIVGVGKKVGNIRDRFPLSQRLYYQWDIDRLNNLIISK